MYKFLYDSWDNERFPGYQKSISDLYDRSLSFYHANPYPDADKEKDIQKINEMFGHFEYYFAGLLKLGFVDRKNFDNVLNQLKGVRLIKLLDPKLRPRLNGLTYNRIVTLNPEPGNYAGLNQSDSFKLTLFHELGHIITDSNKNDLDLLKKCISKVFGFDNEKEECDYFSKGLELLDEVCVENVGEAILFDRKKIERPEEQEFMNPILYPNGIMHSNFVEYREFQELAYRFAYCLSFLDCKAGEDMNSVLHKLSKAMFSKDFCSNLYNEFVKDPDKGEELCFMLMCMGRIKDAKYSSFGLGNTSRQKLDQSENFKMFFEASEKYIPGEDAKGAFEK